MLFRQIHDRKLSQYSYLIGCQATGEALIVDPERDIDRYIDIARSENLEITAVAETHIHADFLAGTRQFAEDESVDIYLSHEGGEEWTYEWATNPQTVPAESEVHLLHDGDTFSIGQIELQVLHTPGHTPEHLSYLVTDSGGGADQPMGMLSGDFMFVNDVGRPDLLESAVQQQGKMKPSAQVLYQSITAFFDMPDFLQIWPAHGAGSACGKALGAVPQTTAGYEKMFNPMLASAQQGEQQFVEEILKGQPEPQMYFSRMKRDNKNGPPLLDHLPEPEPLSVQDLNDLNSETAIIDTRSDVSEFMDQHLSGALFAPTDRHFSTTVGSLIIDETTPIVLLIDESELEETIRDLIRIGYDQITGYLTPDTFQQYVSRGGETRSIDEIQFDAVEELQSDSDVEVLDVRYRSEFDEGHLPKAINASYTRLPEYIQDLPVDQTLLVHCKTGRRAASAASYLQQQQKNVKFVHDDVLAYLDQKNHDSN